MRFFLLVIGFCLILAFVFEISYKKSLLLLVKEAKNVQQLRVAFNFQISFFKNDTLLWIVKGEELNASDQNLISIRKLFAKNFKELLKVQAEKAFYIPKKHLIELLNNVVMEKLTNSGKVLEKLLTDKAYIDLAKNKIYGPDKVVIKRGNFTLSGIGFIYDTKTGRFLILKNGETVIGSD